MFEEVQGKEGGKKASVSDSRYYGLLNEKKKKVSANNNRRGEEKRQYLQKLDGNAWGRTCVTYQFLPALRVMNHFQ